MILTKEIIRFIQTAKRISSKNEVSAVVCEENIMYMSNRHVQISYKLKNDSFSERLQLPVVALSYISCFNLGSNIQFIRKPSETTVTIKCGKSKSTFPLIGIDAPKRIEPSGSYIEFDNHTFETLKKISKACDTDSTKPMANNIYIKTFDSTVFAYATNGIMMASAPLKETNTEIDVRIHKTFMETVLASGFIGSYAKVYQNDRKVTFLSDNYSITIPEHFCSDFDFRTIYNGLKEQYTFLINKGDYSDVLKRMSILDADSKQPACKMTIKEDSFNVTMLNLLKFEEQIDIKAYSSLKPTEIGFRYNQHIIAIGCMDSDKISLTYTGTLSPYCFSDGEIKFLIMPVRISN